MDKQEKRFPWLGAYDAHVPPELTYPDITVNQLLRQAVKKYQHDTFLRYQAKTYSYQRILECISQLKEYLIKIGLKNGDRVAVSLPNIPEFVIAYYSILSAGGIVVAMNPRYTKPEFVNLLNKADVHVLIGLADKREMFEDLQTENYYPHLIIVENPASFDQTQKADHPIKDNQKNIYLDQIINQKDNIQTNSELEVAPDDVAIFQFSGGTTGTPKPAMGTHRNIVANALQFSRWCDLQEGEERILAAIPLYHVYGMVLALNMGIAIGAEIILIDDPTNIENILIQIQEHRVTFYPGVPTMYHAINQNPKVQNKEFDLTSIKVCISGSFTLHRQIKEDFERITAGKLIEGYGLSEAPTATHCNPLYGTNKTGSIGLPLPDVEAKIVDIETGTREMGVGEIGELILRGPQVMKGYYLQPGETDSALRSGWLFTGDIAKMDSEGYFFLVDRKKSLIKVNGLQVWPSEVEQAVKSIQGIGECAVGGVPDQVHGERVICWIVPGKDFIPNTEDIAETLRTQLSSYKIPSEFIFVESLPRSGVGKVLRRELVADYIKKAGL